MGECYPFERFKKHWLNNFSTGKNKQGPVESYWWKFICGENYCIKRSLDTIFNFFVELEGEPAPVSIMTEKEEEKGLSGLFELEGGDDLGGF